LSNHFCIIISAAKINQFLKLTNSLEDFVDIFIQIERNNSEKNVKRYSLNRMIEQFRLSFVIIETNM